MKLPEMKYLKPKSIAWLGGLSLIMTGVSEMIAEGGFSASGLAKIGEGIAIIGIRAKL